MKAIKTAIVRLLSRIVGSTGIAEPERYSIVQEAAVLVPVYRRTDGQLMLVLVRRTERGIHGGQIAFPGGKRIPEDHTPLDTALRESQEEIGLLPQNVEILEHLPVIETRTTGFRIHPFLARVARPREWKLERKEIVEVLEIPISDFADPHAHGEEIRHLPSASRGEAAEARRICFYHVGPHKVWGATYRILKPLLPRLIGGEW